MGGCKIATPCNTSICPHNPMDKSTDTLGSISLKEEEIESFRALLLGPQSQQGGARISPESRLLQVLSKIEPTRGIPTQQGLRAKPKLPAKLCSETDTDIWPFDFYPVSPTA